MPTPVLAVVRVSYAVPRIWKSPVASIVSFTPGTSTVRTIPDGAADPVLTWTCWYHQPLPGVCAYTPTVAGPAGRAPAGTVASNPEFAQYGLPVNVATSGRLSPSVPCASNVPPSPAIPR